MFVNREGFNAIEFLVLPRGRSYIYQTKLLTSAMIICCFPSAIWHSKLLSLTPRQIGEEYKGTIPQLYILRIKSEN